MPKISKTTNGAPEAPTLDQGTTSVTALPGDANPAIDNDDEAAKPEAPTLDQTTTSVTALPGDGNPAIPNDDVQREQEDQPRQRSGRIAINIPGEGSVPVYDRGGMRRMNRGETIHATKGEVAYLRNNGVDFDEE